MGIRLGLHLGHDASASVVDDDGTVLSSVLQERLSRVRHDYGLDARTVDVALLSAGINFEQIQSVGITVTQQMPAFIRDPDRIQVVAAGDSAGSINIQKISSSQRVEYPWLINFLNENLKEFRKIPDSLLARAECLLFEDPIETVCAAQQPLTLLEVVESVARDIRGKSVRQLGRQVQVILDGVRKPGHYWSHHAAHAASNIAYSPARKLIVTHDGGTGLNSGGVWHWTGRELRLLACHRLELGQMYDYFAVQLGLGALGGAGKLMGLAPYGTRDIRLPDLHGGNLVDLARYFASESEPSKIYERLWEFAVREASRLGHDLSRLGSPEGVTDSGPASIANFVQSFVEVTYSEFVQSLVQETNSRCVGLSGGFALNCPTNSAIHEAMPTVEIHVEPHCEDGGCSVGSARLETGRGKLGLLRRQKTREGHRSSEYAYVGPTLDDQNSFRSTVIEPTANSHGWAVIESQDLPKLVARAIASDLTVGLFEGRSEVGPRALGHRSILANPRPLANWSRINQIKSREQWRPFAPAVLQDRLADFFELGPEESPFMLFNYRVREDRRDSLLAVTHVDGTSRVQTVARGDSMLAGILTHLEDLSLPPVVLNTSFNGPGEPIVESPIEAVTFFTNSSLDALVVNGLLLQKMQ